MIELRKLAAIDISILGYRLIVAEYAFGVLFSSALGAFVLVRAHTGSQVLLGSYLISLGLNYAPMLGWALAIGNQENARAEMSDELRERPAVMAKYRKISMILLVPLVPIILAVVNRTRRADSPGGRTSG